jgi:hypothetical protein
MSLLIRETPYGKAGNNCTTMMLFREYMYGGVSSCHDVQKRVVFFMQVVVAGAAEGWLLIWSDKKIVIQQMGAY